MTTSLTKARKRLPFIISGLTLLAVLLLIVLLQWVWVSDRSLLVLGAPAIDANAQLEQTQGDMRAQGQDDSASADSQPQQSSLQYSLSATVQGGTVSLCFKNPADSGAGMVISLMAISSFGQQDCLASSGLLPPGSSITSLTTTDVALEPGTYTGFYKVEFFDPATGDCAQVDATLRGLVITVI